ncbi:helix-turn-helix transcriptional regulator [Nonomuraea sp. K274]|uniref:Helix-turn-helix transcriptional regulator n=1 Tax=Nonomuraea cypriaca TaxID=1187855 RepID=A0A931AGA6_9ACTN|nr:helix-turn-helix transcriptional regulator [Nonomuraea cypriaca]MBF8191428.1 helix-turn-helix transcriptional regulator [Nonomuraea cypriaca]
MADFYAPAAIWGRELRHYRKAAGLTQGQLSEKIHYSERSSRPDVALRHR